MRTPASIGRYRVVSLIGVGASATVFRAVRPEDEFQVAIKVLADNHSAVADTRRRFSDEQRLMAALDDPSIATVYETGETEDGRPYTVMELANRGDLRARAGRLKESGVQLTAADVLTVGRHLRDALTVLRNHEVVHRDISPSNIFIRSDIAGEQAATNRGQALLESDERLLLGDLGFAKRLAEASGLTRGVGTEGFAAPEQRTAISIVDHRADIYSATALIDWLTSGTALTGRLVDFVAKGTADEPSQRHGGVDHWFHDLSQRLDSVQPPAVWHPATPAQKAKPRSMLSGAGLTLAAISVGLLAVLGFQLQSRSNTAGPVTEPVERADGELEAGGQTEEDGEQPDEETIVSTTDEETTTSTNTSETSSTSLSPSTQPSTTTASSTTTPSSTTTTSTSTTSTSASTSTTTTLSTTTTTEPRAGSTTTVNQFPFSPRGYFTQPADGAVITANELTISGTARSPNGIEFVELVIRHIDSSQYWHDDPGEMLDEFVRFPVPVSPARGIDTTWTYRVPTADLPDGSYRLRIWARGVDGTGDPVGESRTITIG